MLSPAGTLEDGMSKPGLDNRHRNHDGEISHKHGNTLIGTLRKIYGMGFAAGYPATEKLSDVLQQLNETSLSQLRRDHALADLRCVGSQIEGILRGFKTGNEVGRQGNQFCCTVDRRSKDRSSRDVFRELRIVRPYQIEHQWRLLGIRQHLAGTFGGALG